MYDRKTWIALAACGIFLAVNFYYSQQNQRERMVREQRQAIAEEQAKPAATSSDPAAAPAAGLVEEPIVPQVEEQFVSLQNDKVEFVMTNVGGGIKYAKIRDQFEVGSSSEPVRINRFGPGPIGAITPADQSIENISYDYKEEQSLPNKKAVFVGRLTSGLIVTKTFSLVEGDKPGSPYLLDLDVTFENDTPNTMDLSRWGLFLGEASALYQAEVPQQTGFFWHEGGGMNFKDVGAFNAGFMGMTAAKTVVTSPAGETLEYAGVTNQFFTTLIRPKIPYPSSIWAKPDAVNLSAGKPPVKGVRAGLTLPAVTLAAKAPQTFSYRIFAGPKDNTMLRKMDNAWEKPWANGWGDVMQYGWFWWVSRPLNWLLNSYHHLLDGVAKSWSWGLAIIFLTVTVRAIIWPLHAKSTRTMKKMSKLQPEIAKLKEKYPDDPNKMNQEMMGLYRKYGINPVGGCLPMLIQIPVFFGFYKMLQYAVELRHQGFLWVPDLSQPDTFHTFHIGQAIPLLGPELHINILPIIMAITSFLQILMTPKTGDKMQQRIILFMPFIFFFFCYNFASALALYWTTQNIFSIGQTWLMSKIPEPELKPRAASGKSTWVQRMAERQTELQKSRNGQSSSKPPKKRNPRTGG